MISAEAVVMPNRKTLRIIEMDIRRDPRWERFVGAHPDALIFHHPGWLAALESEYQQKCLSLACVDEAGQVNAVLPLIYTKGLPLRMSPVASGRRLSSLPRTPVAGPLALDRRAENTIVQYAVELAKSDPGVQLEIKSYNADLHSEVLGLSQIPWRPTYVEELPPALEGKNWDEFWENLRLPRNCVSCEGCRQLRFGNAKRQHRINWSVNKAKKLGLSVREAETDDELQQWYHLYLLTMRNNAVPPRPYRLFQSLWSSLRHPGKMKLLVAELERSGRRKMVAGSILLQFGQTVFYAFTGCDPDDFALHPHDILQIEAIRGACRQGFRWYDFGEVAEEHEALAQFKTKWGGEPRALYRYYSPSRATRSSAEGPGKVEQSARKLWRHLPAKATAVIGDLLYRRM